MEARCRFVTFSTVIVVVVAALLPGLPLYATSIAPPPLSGGAGSTKSAEFECDSGRSELSREEMERIAFAEYEKKGGAIPRGRWETKLVPRGCDWWVLFSLVPAAPGAHFGVRIDGRAGKVEEYAPGY